MRIGVFGNNLNQGYWLAKWLNQRGIEARLAATPLRSSQDGYGWWTDVPEDADFVDFFDIPDGAVYSKQPLLSCAPIRELYDWAAQFDFVLISCEGPAIFSEASDVRLFFVGTGADLQRLPYAAFDRRAWDKCAMRIRNGIKNDGGALRLIRRIKGTLDALAWSVTYIRGRWVLQRRQRLGLLKCDWIWANFSQRDIVRDLKLEDKPRYVVPYPMDEDVLKEIDNAQKDQFQTLFSQYNTVFFSPTRHFIAHKNFGKGNLSLIRGYARFCQLAGDQSFVLVLVRKGPDVGLSEAEINKLGLGEKVIWLEEMANKKVRSLMSLDNVVVCDQFDPSIAYLGNVGREACFFGRPLITGFSPLNEEFYKDDMPPNVYAAFSAEEICAHMQVVHEKLAEDRERLSSLATSWLIRQHGSVNAVDRIIAMFLKVLGRGDDNTVRSANGL